MSSPGSDSYESHTRKRVGKACDRCRLKKSKCDGSSPCSRCKTDDAICVFGERKKSHDKVYPKGYVEMLEQQQHQLVAGMRSLYSKLLETGQWPGAALKEYNGYPLTHDILERLGVLHMTGENPVGTEDFEDNLEDLQERLMAKNGASFARQRRSSPSTDSDPGLAHSQHSTPTMRTASVASSSSSYSRKRASPETPPPSDPSAMQFPSKHQRFSVVPQFEQEPQQLWSAEPYVMGSPDHYDFSTLSETSSMYDPVMLPDLSVAAMNTMAPSLAFTAGTYDELEFQSFMRSGLHPSFS